MQLDTKNEQSTTDRLHTYLRLQKAIEDETVLSA